MHNPEQVVNPEVRTVTGTSISNISPRQQVNILKYKQGV